MTDLKASAFSTLLVFIIDLIGFPIIDHLEGQAIQNFNNFRFASLLSVACFIPLFLGLKLLKWLDR